MQTHKSICSNLTNTYHYLLTQHMDFTKFVHGGAGGSSTKIDVAKVAVAAPPSASRKRKAPAVATEQTPLFDINNPAIAVLSDNQRQVLQHVAAGRNVFMTGRAGCGKSRVTEVLATCLRDAGTAFEITASTGIAAEPLGGKTLHQFLCMVPGADLAACVKRAKYKAEPIKAIKVMFIDEVSMLSAEVMALALDVLRAVRNKRAGLPVLVLVGDFCQLAPVGRSGPATQLLESAVWKSMALHTVILRDSWRQGTGNPEFLRVLDEARFAELSAASLDFLRRRTGARLVHPPDIEPTHLSSLCDDVDAINTSKLAELPGKAVNFFGQVYVATRTAAAAGGGGLCPAERAPLQRVLDVRTEFKDSVHAGVTSKLTQLRVCVPRAASVQDVTGIVHDAASMVSNSSMQPLLQLKVGAQVMFVANISSSVVNGTRGVVTGISEDDAEAAGGSGSGSSESRRTVTVRLLSGVSMSVQTVKRTRPYAPACTTTKDGLLVFEQLPLKLAWAITAHKSQGMSLSLASLDVGRTVFTTGQAYVLLSRMCHHEGFTLTAFEPSAVRADPFVVAWYKAAEAAAADAADAADATAA